ncbi:uncharacterized protein (TIGR02679 family) [Bacillus fengqiuensis]|nr:uncharacterized protein (TIGR02679 family) [Bacillus fengqiuensis]
MNNDVQIFQEEPGFLPLFTLFKEKYRSLGRIGGTVGIGHFSREEVESIAGFLGLSVDVLLEKGKVSLLAFEKVLLHTPFAHYSFIQLLEEVLQEPILTKNEEQGIVQEKEKYFFRSLSATLPDGRWWWDWIQSKSPDTRWIWSLYKQDEADLMQTLSSVFIAFQTLSNDRPYVRLPLFAQRTTGNPHFFDYDQTAGKLLLHCMSVDQCQKGLRTAGLPKGTEEINELLGQYGLMRDDLWSFVTCRGLIAKNEKGIHPVWKAAAETDTVLNVPIKELLKINKAWTAKGNRVWVVENSSVCSTIVDEVPAAPIICTHGQFRTASWVLLDLLIEAGCHLYYSGDLDPEGIAMAYRLKERYADRVTFWRMDESSYEKSGSEEDISSRLTRMESITSPELDAVINAMKRRKKAGYQEALITELISDIKEEFLL